MVLDNWYALRTVSGKEFKAQELLMKRAKAEGITEIKSVEVPVEQTLKTKNGKKVITKQKILSNYILVNMVLTDDCKKFIRSISDISGFASETPLTPAEAKRIFDKVENSKEKPVTNWSSNQVVQIKDGPFEGITGTISEINKDKGIAIVSINIFSRDTPTEFTFDQLEKLA